MTILLKKFGTTLSGRQLGKEAYAAFQPSLREIKDGEKIEVDFAKVVTFTPSWGDEFLSPLMLKFGNKLILKNTENPSVQASLKMLEKIHKRSFKQEK